jgi:hypothetical protein
MNREETIPGQGNRLANAKIYVDDSLCGSLPSTTVGSKLYTVRCNKHIGLTGKKKLKIVNDGGA